MRTVFDNVQDLCKERGLSIYAFERDSGIGNGTTARWAFKVPRLETLKAAATFFKVPIGALLDGTEYELGGPK